MTDSLKIQAVLEAQALCERWFEEMLEDGCFEDQDFADAADEIVGMSKVPLKWEWGHGLEVKFQAI